ncbi:hypothetical protein DRP04_07960 [Archaeoglobales archaeon]|nr:MAG: hypothetical protein DRP04_07960 [Archaeoglobales archaeon]
MRDKAISLKSALRALRYSLGSVSISSTNKRLIFYEFIHSLNRYRELNIEETEEILERVELYLEGIA